MRRLLRPVSCARTTSLCLRGGEATAAHPDIRLHEIDVARPLEIAGERIVPVSGHHSERFEVTGYRIGRMAYLT